MEPQGGRRHGGGRRLGGGRRRGCQKCEGN